MASEYVRLHIMKHALEHYIKREGASEKDIRQEKKVLDDVVEELENFKDFINSWVLRRLLMEKLEAIKCSDQKLEIYLTDGDLEAIANGHEVVIPLYTKNRPVKQVSIRPALRQDLLNPLVNFDNKLMSQTDLIAKDFGRQIVADTFKL